MHWLADPFLHLWPELSLVIDGISQMETFALIKLTKRAVKLGRKRNGTYNEPCHLGFAMSVYVRTV